MNKRYKKAILVSLASIALSVCTVQIVTYKDDKEYLEEDSDLIALTNKEASLVNMSIDDKSYGILVDLDEGKEVLKRVGELYIDNGEIDKKTILSVDVDAKVEYDEESNGEEANSVDSIAEKIVNDNNVDDIVDINMKCREIRQEEIKPEVTVIEDENMYMGETKQEEGTIGFKEVIANVNYVNGIKTGEEVISEKVLVDSTDTIVYKGAKSPINDCIAFLDHPTGGGYITSNFGWRWGRKHNGIDISHNTGDPVYAALDGTVVECGYVNGYGNKITIEHENNIKTVYAHLSSFNIHTGDKVKEGDLIGKVGSTGNSTGPHLHFELRVNGVPINPINYIKA